MSAMEMSWSGCARRSSDVAVAASSECPPSSMKKSASTESWSSGMRKTLDHTSVIPHSASVAGGTSPIVVTKRGVLGSGRFFRSTLPLTIIGIAGRIS